MRQRGTKTKIVLVVVLLAAAYAAYRVGRHVWGRHHWDAARQALERRDFGQASGHLQACLAVWPGDASVRLLAAQAARRGGDFVGARRELTALEPAKEAESERLRELQLLRLQRGDPAQADLLLEACTNKPRAPGAYLILEAVLEAKVKQLEGAYNAGMSLMEGPAGQERVKAEQALDLWSELRLGTADRVQGLIWRGRIHLLSNQQEAAADFRQALELDPNHFDARLYLAAALIETDARETIQHLERLRQREPGNVHVGLLLASSHRGLGQLAEAQQILDEMLAVHPDLAAAWLERGKAALDAGRPEEAERFLRRALDLDPREPFIHLALSRCLHLLGKTEEAKVHQQRYGNIEAERTAAERSREEQGRIWRRSREEQEAARRRDAAGGR